MRRAIACLGILLTLPRCDPRDDPRETAPSERRRPVTVAPLRWGKPPSRSALGIARPYREGRLAFDVGGRVEFVLDAGSDATSALLDDEGRVVREGTVLARLESTRYRQALESVEAALRSARGDLRALEIDLSRVASSEERAAEAQLEMARSEASIAEETANGLAVELELAENLLQREESLLPGGGSSRETVDEARARLAAAEARHATARGGLEARAHAIAAAEAALARVHAARKYKASSIETTSRRIDEILAAKVKAEIDLASCELRAPYGGRVTAVHAVEGAAVGAGDPVLTLTLLDPIQISVAVSGSRERAARFGDLALVRLPGAVGSPGLPGLLMRKVGVAGASTRTFELDFLLRNVERPIDDVAAPPDLAPIADVLPAITRYAGEGGPLFVCLECLMDGPGGPWVLRIPDLGAVPSSGAVAPEKIRVVPGEDRLTVVNWSFVEVREAAGLAEGDFLVVDPRPEHERGGVLLRQEWAVRPGDLLEVDLPGDVAPAGFYVPDESVIDQGGHAYVFLAREGVARRIEVKAGSSRHGWRRVEGDGIEQGTLLVLREARSLSDGEPVRLLGEGAR